MKNIYLFSLVLLLPFWGLSQANNIPNRSSGFSIGANAVLIFAGEFGVFGEYFTNYNSFYTFINYNRAMLGKDKVENVDFVDKTNSYFCASGPVLRVGYRRLIKSAKRNRRSFFVGAEFIYKNLSYSNITLERLSDKNYLKQNMSMQSSRYGGALRMGLRSSLHEGSIAYWSIGMAAGALYNAQTNTLHYSKQPTNTPINEPYSANKWVPTVSLNLILGIDFL